MAAQHTVILTAAQREMLINEASVLPAEWVTTDKHGNRVHMKISIWKGLRLYIEFRGENKFVNEKTYLDLKDANDLRLTFNGDSNALILLEWIDANMPATAEEIADVEYEIIEEMAEGAIVEVAFPYTLANIVDRVNLGGISVDAGGEYGTARAISWGGMGAGKDMKRTITIERSALNDFIARVAKAKARV